MSADAFILARSCAEPDAEFPTLAQLARSIVRCAGADRPINLNEAQVSRGMLPGGRAVSVHLGRAFLGYAFMAAAHSVAELREAVEHAEALAHAH